MTVEAQIAHHIAVAPIDSVRCFLVDFDGAMIAGEGRTWLVADAPVRIVRAAAASILLASVGEEIHTENEALVVARDLAVWS